MNVFNVTFSSFKAEWLNPRRIPHLKTRLNPWQRICKENMQVHTHAAHSGVLGEFKDFLNQNELRVINKCFYDYF